MKKRMLLRFYFVVVVLIAGVMHAAPGGLMVTTMVTFNGTNGDHPNGELVQGSNGMLYGVTTAGGSGNFGLGTIFRTTLDGSLTTLVSFNGTNGESPISAPVLASDGNFYGTTILGGD